MKPARHATLATIAFVVGAGMAALAAAPGSPDPVKEADGLWTARDGSPTYNIGPDGTVDWGTFVGYLRYSESCLRCHGPDGAGSAYVPALAGRLKDIDHSQFMAAVTNGIKAVSTAQQLVMPAFANNRNVTCFIDEIYSYLRARATGALGRGRPAKHAPAPKGFDQAADKCLGIAE